MKTPLPREEMLSKVFFKRNERQHLGGHINVYISRYIRYINPAYDDGGINFANLPQFGHNEGCYTAAPRIQSSEMDETGAMQTHPTWPISAPKEEGVHRLPFFHHFPLSSSDCYTAEGATRTKMYSIEPRRRIFSQD